MMSAKKVSLLVICVLAILFPITSYTATNDLAIFLHGAKTIVEGGKIYVDFLDIKPPIAYYSMIPIYLISKMDISIVRLIEYLIQSLTAVGLGLYLYRRINFQIAILTSIVYSLLVVTLNIPFSFQLELIFNFLIILLFIIHLKIFNQEIKQSFGWILIEGIIIGFYFSIKYTTGLILGGILLFDIFYKKKDILYFVKYYGILSIGFIAAVILIFSPLFDAETMQGYKDVMEYLSYYTSIIGFDIPFVYIFFVTSSNYFIDNFSITFLIAVSIAVIIWIRGKKQLNFSKEHLILSLSIFLTIALITSAMIERKGFSYHYARSYLPISILIGFGINALINFFKSYVKVHKLKVLLPTTLILLLLIVFSPLTRYIAVLRFPFAYYFNNKAYYNLLQEPETNPLLNYKERKEVGDFINSNSDPKEKILTMTSGLFDIVQFQKLEVIDKFSHSGFYYGTYKKEKWRENHLELIKQADWILMSTNDYNYIANGHFLTTYESFQKDTVAMNLVDSFFKQVYKTPSILLFHRKENLKHSER